MITRFAFGKDGIDIYVPGVVNSLVVCSRSGPALNDLSAALDEVFERPVGTMPLQQMAANKRTAAISVCDITRPAPNRITLPPLLRRLHAAGIPPEGITILIATGLHRTATPEEIDIILGREIAANYRVVSHDARDSSSHVGLGITRSGTPVFIDKRFIEADLHITLGFVEPHLMLGFSAGRKLIAPGLAAEETIKALHSPRFMREPLAVEGSIEGNPLHAELLDIAAKAGHDFVLDVTMTQDRQISGIFAGHPVKAHAAAVDFLQSASLTSLDGLADAVITSAGGYPLDLTFYQTIKGISAAQHIVKPGGKILVVGQCAEGIGSGECREMLKAFPGHASFLDAIEKAPVRIDQWQLEKMALAGLKHPLLFHTPGAPPHALGSLASQVYTDLTEAVAALLDGLAPNARVALIPDGPYTYARPVPAFA